jgi:hypothetical protein
MSHVFIEVKLYTYDWISRNNWQVCFVSICFEHYRLPFSLCFLWVIWAEKKDWFFFGVLQYQPCLIFLYVFLYFFCLILTMSPGDSWFTLVTRLAAWLATQLAVHITRAAQDSTCTINHSWFTPAYTRVHINDRISYIYFFFSWIRVYFHQSIIFW